MAELLGALLDSAQRALARRQPATTARQDKSNWKFWCEWCQLMGTSPVRSDSMANQGLNAFYGRELALVVAAFMFWCATTPYKPKSRPQLFSEVCAPAPTLATELQTNILNSPGSAACSCWCIAMRGALVPLQSPAQVPWPASCPAPRHQIDVRRQRPTQLKNAACHETRVGIGSRKGRDPMLALRWGLFRP